MPHMYEKFTLIFFIKNCRILKISNPPPNSISVSENNIIALLPIQDSECVKLYISVMMWKNNKISDLFAKNLWEKINGCR